MYVKYPVNKVGITSDFGLRTHPITKVSRYHYGLDLGWINDQGEPVYATHDATVIEEGYTSSMGNYIVLKYVKKENTIINIYMHLKQRSLIKKGKKVKHGEKLGYMGETGLAQGVHLHFEYWVCPKNYKYKSSDDSKYAKDPLNYLYLFDDQTVTKNSSSRVKKVVGTPTTRNKDKNQVQVLQEYLNCRDNSSLSAKVLGCANLGYYNVLDKKESNGYTWYRIDYNKWIANVKDYVKVLNKEEQPVTPTPTPKPDPTPTPSPKPEPQDPKTLEDYNSFTASNDGYYCIYLKQIEKIYYPKQKDSN